MSIFYVFKFCGMYVFIELFFLRGLIEHLESFLKEEYKGKNVKVGFPSDNHSYRKSYPANKYSGCHIRI